MNEGLESIGSAAVELQNLREAFEDVRQLVEKDAEIERLKTKHQVMKKF